MLLLNCEQCEVWKYLTPMLMSAWWNGDIWCLIHLPALEWLPSTGHTAGEMNQIWLSNFPPLPLTPQSEKSDTQSSFWVHVLWCFIVMFSLTSSVNLPIWLKQITMLAILHEQHTSRVSELAVRFIPQNWGTVAYIFYIFICSRNA